MSVNIYDHASGKTLPLASGTRTWIGTRADYENAKRLGTLPLNSLIAITDDEQGGEEGSLEAIIGKNAGARNSIFRGMNLGGQVTAEQYDAIDAGTFEGLMLGDYWEINDVKYRIAHFDYWYDRCNNRCMKHHIVIVPDGLIGTDTKYKMNDTNTTTGGYLGSKLRTESLANIEAVINAAFGSNHILHHQAVLTHNTTGSTWYQSNIDLMSEGQVYGHKIYGKTDKTENQFDFDQFALFRADRFYELMRGYWNGTRMSYWLRTIASDADEITADTAKWCYVNVDGLAYLSNATSELYIRPQFGICKSN